MNPILNPPSSHQAGGEKSNRLNLASIAKKSVESSPRQKPTKRVWAAGTSDSLRLGEASLPVSNRIREKRLKVSGSIKQSDAFLETAGPPLYVAMRDYKAHHNLELSVKNGEFINVVDNQSLDSWYVHNHNAKYGWVPSRFLRRLGPVPLPLIENPKPDFRLDSNVPLSSPYPKQPSQAADAPGRLIHPHDTNRYNLAAEIKNSAENRTQPKARDKTEQRPEFMVSQDLALDKVEVTTTDLFCDFHNNLKTAYGCINEEIFLPAEALPRIYEACKQRAGNENDTGTCSPATETPELTESQPKMDFPATREQGSSPQELLKPLSYNCPPFQYGCIDIAKAQICSSCKDEKMQIVKHRHVEFSPSGARGCMVCTGAESFQCTGCPLQLCALCSVQMADGDAMGGGLDLLISSRIAASRLVRNDVVLLRKDGRGY